jgi:transcriptional regulatory protein LevR
MLVTNHTTNTTSYTVPKCIKIRNNVSLPPVFRPVMSKYGFISLLEVGESFEVNGDTPEYKAKSLAPAAYTVASHVRKTTNKNFKIACRTIEGTSSEPIRSAVWRIA